MDDGSSIKLKVTVNEDDGAALCDFTGSGNEVCGNCNAPRAITLSAFLSLITAIIPKNSVMCWRIVLLLMTMLRQIEWSNGVIMRQWLA